ncbi:unnamed protein product (mitochondrion) [Plasmodiophora brassicae]|uniref:Uncharacterized protein n=1 Tax=Plasmodiophora brassicae TaxID=37360 RepID=A0A3P3YGI8_PLABS|nr:unnamed protein product [Plasmodiophora brassicae]
MWRDDLFCHLRGEGPAPAEDRDTVSRLSSRSPKQPSGKMSTNPGGNYLDALIARNFPDAFTSAFGDFTGAPAPPVIPKVPSLLDVLDGIDFGSVEDDDNDDLPGWNRKGAGADTVVLSMLVAEERFAEALAGRQDRSIWASSPPSPTHLTWSAMLALVPDEHLATFHRQFPQAPISIAKGGSVELAAEIQTRARSVVRRLIGVLPGDVPGRTQHWIILLRAVVREVQRCQEVVNAFVRAGTAELPPVASGKLIAWANSMEAYCAGLVELIRMAYRLASTFASLRCLPPGSPAVITCQDTIVAVEQLAHALSSVSSVSSSWNAIQIIREHLNLDGTHIGSGIAEPDVRCDVCMQGCVLGSGSVRDGNVLAHASCANLFVRVVDADLSSCRPRDSV